MKFTWFGAVGIKHLCFVVTTYKLIMILKDLKSLEEYLKFLQRLGEWCLEGGTTLESIQVPSHPFCPMLTNSSKEDTGEQIRLVLGLPLSRSF